jgi:nascent polypeptide-associated complex subunit alpha
MFPGMNMNSSQMKQAMKKMGITQNNLDAEKVIIRLHDRDIIIDSPDVAKVNMMGQETYQIIGEAREELRDTTPQIDEEDIQTVISQTSVSREDAIDAINDAEGDLAQAIMSLKKEEE